MDAGSEFVGRRDELAVLERALADADAGHSRFVLITGEPGIGKTSLAMELARRAAIAGACIGSARAWDGAGAPAFWLWRACLRDLGDDLAMLANAPIVGDEARFAALESIADRVRSAARGSLHVLVLDDAQWADVPSLLALKLLARTARQERLCVLITMREPNEAAADVLGVIGDVRREAIVLPVDGLVREDLAKLAHARGVAGPGAIDAIARATSGNALYAVELLGDRDARRALEGGHSVPAPRGVKDMLARHLARLGEGVRDVVAWAAVQGDPIVAADIASAAALPSTDVGAAMEAASREGILRCVEGAIRFAHDLFRTAAYETITRERRAHMHASFAHVLGIRDPYSATHVHHLFAAGPEEATDESARAALAAARGAIARLAYEEAATSAQRAVSVYERTGQRAALASALATLAEAVILGGETERATSIGARALSVARESGEAPAFARAALAVALRRTLGVSDRSVVATLEDALARLDATADPDVTLRCAVEARLAAALQPTFDPPRAIALARTAIERARVTGDAACLARTLHAARPAFRMLEPMGERAAMDHEILGLADRLGDLPLSAHAHVRLFFGALEAGDPIAAESMLASLEALADRLRLPSHELAALTARCVHEILQGHITEAERIVDEIERTRDRWQPALATALPVDPVLVMRMNLAAVTGSFDQPRPTRPGVIDSVMNVFFDARSGRLAQAAAAFPAVAERCLVGDVGYMMRTYLGDTCGRIGSKAFDPRLYELCLPFEGRHNVWTPLPGYDGAVDRILGSLAATSGDRATALRHYDAAIAMESRLGASPFAERSVRERAAIAPVSSRVPSPRVGSAPPTFEREGETWLITYGDERTRVKDADGFRYIAFLVARPDVPVPVVELFAERAAAHGTPAQPSGDAGEMLDREAVAAYRERAHDLREVVEQAEARNDLGALAKARQELEFIEDELARAVGLRGQARRAGSDLERLRVNITTRIRRAIEKLAEPTPGLARHLERAIRTGTTCTYRATP